MWIQVFKYGDTYRKHTFAITIPYMSIYGTVQGQQNVSCLPILP